MSSPVRQNLLRGAGEMGGVERRGSPPIYLPTIIEDPFLSYGGSALLKHQSGEDPPGATTSTVFLGLSLRGTAALIQAQLATSVHPSPGFGVRIFTGRGTSPDGGRLVTNVTERTERKKK